MSLADQAVHFLIFLSEPLAVEFVLQLLIRADRWFSCLQYRCHSSLIVISDGEEESMTRFLGGRESRLVGLARDTEWSERRQEQCDRRECNACGGRRLRVHRGPPPPWAPPPP